MELSETIDTINRQLMDTFGIDVTYGYPIYRVVWSEDQFEKRMMDHTDSGIQLLSPQLRTVPKYRQWITERYVLEQLVLVPEISKGQLAGLAISYEPLFVFQHGKTGEYLPPKWEASKFIIDLTLAAKGKQSMRKYVDNDSTPEGRDAAVRKLEEELFGNETEVGDALAHKQAIVVPGLEPKDTKTQGE